MLIGWLGIGAGLLRIGRTRLALVYIGAWIALLALLTATWLLPPMLTPGLFALAATLALATLLLGIACLAATWRASRARGPRGPFGSWVAIIVWIIAVQLGVRMLASSLHSYRTFHAPSEGMLPTIRKGDNFVADMRRAHPLQRGELVLVRLHGSDFIRRIGALGGDRIAFHGGWLILNGSPVPTRLVGIVPSPSQHLPVPTGRIYEETIPGGRAHRILDLVEHGPGDERSEIVVPPGHLFLLGDNRDDSADSRYPEPVGSGLPPESVVIGEPLFTFWRHGPSDTPLR